MSPESGTYVNAGVASRCRPLGLEVFILKVHDRLIRWLDGVLAGPLWKGRALILVLVLSLFRAFPSYDGLGTPFVRATWAHTQIKIDHPFTDMSRLFPPESHENKLTFRLTVPVFAYALRLRQPGVLALYTIAGLFLLYSVLAVGDRLTGSRRVALYLCLVTVCAWPGAAAFHELRGGYYDVLAICALALAMWSRRSPMIAVWVFVACWTDERALLSLPLVFLFWVVADGPGDRAVLGWRHVAILLGAAGYVASRAYLTMAYSLPPFPSAAGLGWNVLLRQVNIIPLGIATALSGGWLLIGVGIVAAWLQGRRALTFAFCAALGLVIAAAFCVVDVTRSMAYCLPAVFVAIPLLRQEPVRVLEKLAFTCCVVSFLIPTYYLEGSTGLWWLYPLPVQALRWMQGI